MSKNFVLDTWSVSDESTNLKNKTTIDIQSESIEDLTFSIDEEGLFVVSNGTDERKFKNYSSIKYISTTEGDGSIVTTDIIANALVNNNNIISTAKKGKLSGTKYNDTIVGTENKDKISAGKGDDVIYSSLGNDTISGGAGKNTVVYSGNFDTDTITLTKNENLKLDLSAYDVLNHDFNYTVSKKFLVIDVTDKEGNVLGTIKLKNFGSKNVVGANGSVTLLLSDGEELDLNKFNLISFDETNFNSKGKLTGTRFAETIDARNLNRNATISGGAGYNTIYGTNGYTDKITGGNDGNYIITGSGTKTVKTGKGTDTIVATGYGQKTIKAGAGNNTIIIDNNSSFGDVIVTEEKVYANNTISFKNDISDCILVKYGNDLIISDAKTNSSVTLKSYYLEGGKYANYTVTNNDKTFSNIDALVRATSEYIIGGKGTITGSMNADKIVAADADTSVKASNDTIKSGKGNDVINAGRGSNSIYFYEGDGVNTVVNGGGTDTLVFAKGTKLSYRVDGNNLVVDYGNGNDSVIVKDYFTNSSVKYIKVGSTKLNISSCYKFVNRGDSATTIKVSSSALTILTLKDTFEGKDYTYEIKSNSGSQNLKVEYLENGRLVLTGNHIDITAAKEQKDDIILLGSNNSLDTGDLDDIVRLGFATDGSGRYYCKQSDNNKINTGNGDDHVVFYGLNNKINSGAGEYDTVMSAVPGTNMKKESISNSQTSLAADQISYNTLNNKIDWFSQGTTGGDCRLFALLKSMSEGKNFSLSKYVTITQANNGYNVTFNKYRGTSNKTCFVASSALNKYSNAYGDIDVVLIDYAMNQLLAKNEYSLVEDCAYNELAMYIFGNYDITVLNRPYDESNFDSKFYDLWNKYTNGDVTNITVGLQADNSDYKLGIITGHAYSISDLTQDYVTLVNPWDSNDKLTLEMGTFYDMEPCVISYGVDCYDQWIWYNNYNMYQSVSDMTDTDLGSLTEDVLAWTTNCAVDCGIEAVVSTTDNVANLVAAYMPENFQNENAFCA